MKTSNLIIILSISAVFSSSLVTALFLVSEEAIDRNNAFIRRYPHHPIKKVNQFDLGYNSYYIAGVTKDSIYLGNYTAPRHLLAIDKQLRDTSVITLNLDRKSEFNFKKIQVQVDDGQFYLFDGTIPIIYKGDTANWYGKIISYGDAYFSKILRLAENIYIIQSRITSNNENELGKLAIYPETTIVQFNRSILKKQINGIFDVDGFLLYNKEHDKTLYVYRYRNEFKIISPDLELNYTRKTIDTISIAQLDLLRDSDNNLIKLGPNAIVVNQHADTFGDYLFIASERLGKFEPEEMLNQATIIDTYNFPKNKYDFSFYLYDVQNQKIKDFKIEGDQLFGIAGSILVSYELKPSYFNL